MATQTKIVTIDLDTRSYEIFIGKSLLFRIHDFIPQDLDGRAVFIVTDRNVEKYAGRIADAIRQNGARRCEILTLPAGEKTKSFKNVEKISDWFLQNNLGRDSLVLAVGGGVIGDITGFCASIAMRGVDYIQVPTTLLAQVDSSVGGKTGINTERGKNLVGSFYQPKAVIADLETLATLPRRELLSGYAEIAKYGLIEDAEFFEWLEQNGEAVCALEDEALGHAIEMSCRAKARIVESDERESGRRALLNFGHTFGHALEAAAGYSNALLHGEAVAIGMIMAFDLSHRMGLCALEDLERAESHLETIGLPTRASTVDGLSTNVETLMDLMRGDKKTSRGALTFILSNGIGEAFIGEPGGVDEDLVRAVLRDSLGGLTKKGTKGRWTSAFSSHS